MKYLVVLVLAISLISCKSENDCVDQNNGDIQLLLPNGDNLTVPSCWELVAEQGHDSAPGRIVYEQKDILIRYDIGLNAGNYVDEDSPNKIIENSVNEEFWYEVVDKQYLNDEDCCVYFTFPERGPANFITPNDENFDKVLEVMKTYKSN